MAALTLRVLTRSGDTTKNAPLTNAEIDTNFINIDAEMETKAPIASPTFTGSVTIPGGTINNTSVGGTTRSTGAFTTLTANGATTLTANTASTTTGTGTLVVTGGVGVSGQVTAGVFAGDGSELTGLHATNLATGTVPGDRGVTAGSATASFVEYNGTTKTAGQFDGGTTAPTNVTRLNYDGYLYATRFYGDGSQLSSVAAASVTNGVYTTGDQTIGGIKTFSSTITGSVSGNAGTVTNGVYTSGSYADPSWITSLAFSKITGSGVLSKNVQVISTNTTAVSGRTYVLTASLTLTLPASPTAGMTVEIINRSGTVTAVVGRNAVNIMGLAEDMTIDDLNASFTLTYADATRGWVVNL